MAKAGRGLLAVKTVADVAKLPTLLADRRALDRTSDVPGILRRLCRPAGKSHIVADQVPGEIEGLAALVAERRPSVVVEIGTSKGGTLYLWSRLAREGALVVSIDMPNFSFGSVRAVNRWVYRGFGAARGVEVRPLAADSHAPETRAELERILAGRAVDFLFIDGDHSYAGVKADFEAYGRLMAPDGIVAFHDIAFPPGGWIDVQRFWREVERGPHRTRTFVADGPEPRGIGVVFLGERRVPVPAG